MKYNDALWQISQTLSKLMAYKNYCVRVTIAGCLSPFKERSNIISYGNIAIRYQFNKNTIYSSQQSRGPFLEGPENFSGPKS